MDKKQRLTFLQDSYNSYMKNRKAVVNIKDFDELCSWYFSISPNASIDKKMEACAKRAYRDLGRKPLAGIGKMPNIKKERWKKETQTTIIQAINEIPIIKSQKEYDNWHKIICIKMQTIAKEHGVENYLISKSFSYGLAQKWLNMTIKYMLIMDIPMNVEEHFLHIPIDSYILEAAWNESEKIDLPYKKGKSRCKKFKYDDITAWSQLEKEQYQKLQDSIRSVVGNNLVEWENDVWLKVRATK